MDRYGKCRALLAVPLAGLFAAALVACSSSSNSGSASDGPIVLGVIAPLTGQSAASFGGGQIAAQARIDLQNASGGVDGRKIKVIVADDQSTPTGALAAAQLLVQKDHVFGVLAISADTYGAARYLQQQKVPVVGPGSDGPEWAEAAYNNMFPDYGSFNPHYFAPTTFGTFFKGRGVTKFASVGINILAGQGSIHEANVSVQDVGIPVAYTNDSVPVGSTDFGAIALALKSSGANGLFLGMTANSNIALVTALKQAGANIPVILGTGYGSDTLASPPSVAAMQGVYILNWAETQSDNTAATREEAAALAKYANIKLPPGSHMEQGWLAAEEFIEGLQGDKSATPASFISYMRNLKTNAGGLFGSHDLDFSQFGNLAQGTGPGNCLWITQLEGTKFQIVPDADPVCGSIIPNSGISNSGS